MTIEPVYLLICIPFIFVILVSIFISIYKRKTKIDLNEIFELEKEIPDSLEQYEIYSKGKKAAASLAAGIIIAGIGLSIVLSNLLKGKYEFIVLVLVFILILIFSIMNNISYIPSFFFKCPKCELRNMKKIEQILIEPTHFNYGRKKVYLKCSSCGFSTKEEITLSPLSKK
jgi:uncharacterized integral membrane protein